MKTIKQIADEIGVSKQKVYRYIKANCISEVHHEAHQKHFTKHYSEAVVSQIKSHFTGDEAYHEVHHEALQTESNDAVIEAVVIMLKQELEAKNKQIEDLTSALVLAQQTAAAAQALHAGTMKSIVDIDKKRPNILSRFFNRGKDMSK